MKKMFVALVLNLFLLPLTVSARDDVGSYSILEAMDLDQTKEKLGESIRFYFGNQEYGEIARSFGEFRTNKKTNAFNKSDLQACQWVFLSAMITLRDRAQKEGGNAVVNIKSNYKNNRTSSEDTFQCGAGAFVAGVALVGTVVTLSE